MDISAYKDIIESKNFFEKAIQGVPLLQKSHGHLIAKKVQVFRDGKWFQTTRWVSPDHENPEDTTHLSKVVVNAGLKTSEKIRALIDGGVYEPRELMELSGAKYYSQAHTELKNKNIDIAALRAQSTGAFVVPTDIPDRPDFTAPEVQKMAIADLQKVSQTKAFEAQKELKVELSKKFGVTVQDKWDAYEFKIHQILQTGYPKALLAYGTGGVGKIQSSSCKVYTKDGFTTIGELQIGQKILTPSGRESTILNIFPHKDHSFYRVTLADGTSTLAGLEHLWRVWDKTSHWSKDLKKRVSSGRYMTMSTEEILKKGLRIREKSISSNGREIPAEWRFLIPYLPIPVDFNLKEELPIHPYILGYMLGNGTMSSTIAVTIGKEDQKQILAYFELLGYPLKPASLTEKWNGLDFRFEDSVRQKFRDLQLFDHTAFDKFIPQQYLYSSFSNRLALLQGLMDSDGSCEGKGKHLVFYTVSDQLGKDAQQLALSFGKHASLSQVKRKFTGKAINKEGDELRVNTCNQVYFTIDQKYNPFILSRKAELFANKNTRPDIRGKSIVSIEFECITDGACIMIDDPEHLYITDDFITTHNTYTLEKALNELQLRPFDEMIHSNSVGGGVEKDFDGYVDDEDVPKYDNYDYVKITGSAGKKAIHEALYYNRDKIIIFDDCDSMWEDEELMNVLKGALDTSGDGTISFKQDLKVGDGEKIPKRFKFEGRVIFISNYSRQDFIKAGASPIVDSRASAIDLTMTVDQTLDRMEQIAPYISIKNNKGVKMNIDPVDRTNAIKMLREVKDYVRVEQLNGRTLGQLIALSAELTRQGKFSEEQYVRQSLISLDLV